MRTDELITVLARDATVARMTTARAAAIMVPAAALIAAASFLAAFPVRPGLPGPAAAAVAMKLAVTLTLAASGLAAAMAMARPAPPRPARLAALALAPRVVTTLLAFDLATHGLAVWRARRVRRCERSWRSGGRCWWMSATTSMAGGCWRACAPAKAAMLRG